MDRESKKISRAELYEQVWTVPMTRLAKDYGLSDVGWPRSASRKRSLDLLVVTGLERQEVTM